MISCQYLSVFDLGEIKRCLTKVFSCRARSHQWPSIRLVKWMQKSAASPTTDTSRNRQPVPCYSLAVSPQPADDDKFVGD